MRYRTDRLDAQGQHFGQILRRHDPLGMCWNCNFPAEHILIYFSWAHSCYRTGFGFCGMHCIGLRLRCPAARGENDDNRYKYKSLHKAVL